MKKILIVIGIVVLATLAINKAIAEEVGVNQTLIDQSENDYRFAFDQYRTSHDVYVTAKAEFLKNGNLKTQQDALVAAKDAAGKRAEVLKTYTRWITLRLMLYQTAFPQVSTSVDRLNKQFSWYTDEQAKIQAAQTQAAFEVVMADYVKTQIDRDGLYAQAEIDLKLAQVANFQQIARATYDPLLIKLQQKTTIPEVSQGMAKIVDLGEKINQVILDTKTKSGAIESGDLGIFQAFRQSSEKLEMIRTTQLTLVNTMIELENRYGE